MFGIIYSLASLLGFGVSGTKCAIDDIQAKRRGYERIERGENPGNVYYDHNGAMRELATGQFVSYENDYVTGDVWLRRGAPSNRYRNLSAEWRNLFYLEKQQHPEEGRTVICDIEVKRYVSHKTASITDTIWKDEYYCEGQWYKDLKTGALYAARYYNGAKFYMDIKTRLLVRPTDEFLEDNKRKKDKWVMSNEELNNSIDEWNKKIRNGEWNEKISYKPGTEEYMRYYYFNNNITKDQRDYEEKEMMGNVQPRHK